MRRRILALTLATTLLVVAAFVVPLAVLIGSETVQRAQRRVAVQAQLTAFAVDQAVRDGTLSTALAASLATTDAEDGTATLVQYADGTTTGSVPAGVLAAVGPPPAPDPEASASTGAGAGAGAGSTGSGGSGGRGPGLSPGGPGQLQAVPGGQAAVTLARDAGARVVVFVTDGQLRRGATGWWLLLAGSSVGLVVLAAGAAVVVSRRISAPLTRTAEAAHRLSAGDGDARAPVAGPREVAEVGTALNRLAERIDELVDEERETVADLSHRLRTPLTALRLDADGLRDPAEAERIGAHVAAVERTLTAVIRAARRAEREGLVPACDATAVVDGRTRFWSALAEDQDRRLAWNVPAGPVAVRAGAEDLAAAVDALLENVLAHTPEGVDFRVDLQALPGGGAELVVTDSGPGIPVDAAVRGRSDRGSTGLGLSIAGRCAELSGGRLEVATAPGGGGLVRLRLGPP